MGKTISFQEAKRRLKKDVQLSDWHMEQTWYAFASGVCIVIIIILVFSLVT